MTLALSILYFLLCTIKIPTAHWDCKDVRQCIEQVRLKTGSINTTSQDTKFSDMGPTSTLTGDGAGIPNYTSSTTLFHIRDAEPLLDEEKPGVGIFTANR